MKVFITRVWGFDPERWPVIMFGLEGDRDILLRDSSPGDRIVFVGTLRDPTPEALRGRLLGIAQISRIAVDTLDVISDDVQGPQGCDGTGRLRWPKAGLMEKAWRFTPQPRLLEVLTDQLPYHAASQSVLLSHEDAHAVFTLPSTEVSIPASVALTTDRLLNQTVEISGPTTGPAPSSWNGSTGRDVNRTAFNYALRFGSTGIWKIGHTIDISQRIKQANWHIPPKIVPQRWSLMLHQRWANETDAHAMEQSVLGLLQSYRTSAERVSCSEAELLAAWSKGFRFSFHNGKFAVG